MRLFLILLIPSLSFHSQAADPATREVQNAISNYQTQKKALAASLGKYRNLPTDVKGRVRGFKKLEPEIDQKSIQIQLAIEILSAAIDRHSVAVDSKKSEAIAAEVQATQSRLVMERAVDEHREAVARGEPPAEQQRLARVAASAGDSFDLADQTQQRLQTEARKMEVAHRAFEAKRAITENEVRSIDHLSDEVADARDNAVETCVTVGSCDSDGNLLGGDSEGGLADSGSSESRSAETKSAAQPGAPAAGASASPTLPVQPSSASSASLSAGASSNPFLTPSQSVHSQDLSCGTPGAKPCEPPVPVAKKDGKKDGEVKVKGPTLDPNGLPISKNASAGDKDAKAKGSGPANVNAQVGKARGLGEGTDKQNDPKAKVVANGSSTTIATEVYNGRVSPRAIPTGLRRGSIASRAFESKLPKKLSAQRARASLRLPANQAQYDNGRTLAHRLADLHAKNADLWFEMRKRYQDLSATLRP